MMLLQGAAAPVHADSSVIAPLQGAGEAGNQLVRRVLFLPEQASTAAAPIDQLHYFELGTMSLIAVVLGLTGIWFIFRFRRRRGDGPTRRVVAPLWLEAGGAASLLALFLFWWLLSFRQYAHAKAAPSGALDVYVSSKQWMWQFAYPSGRSSAGILYVPAEKPVRLLLTSRDVIHSFYVPAFRIKQDAVPGRYTTIWFQAVRPGAWRVFCAELCGVGHSRMGSAVVALSQADFERWLGGWEPDRGELARMGLDLDQTLALHDPAAASMNPADADLAAQGEKVAAAKGCFRCHTVDGTPYTGPSWRGLFGKIEKLEGGGRVLVDAGYLTESMMDPEAKVVAGYTPVMPSYFGQLDAGQTAALVEYIRSLSGASVEGARPRPSPPPRAPEGVVPVHRNEADTSTAPGAAAEGDTAAASAPLPPNPGGRP